MGSSNVLVHFWPENACPGHVRGAESGGDDNKAPFSAIMEKRRLRFMPHSDTFTHYEGDCVGYAYCKIAW
jgi:hypothetical protein